MLSKDAKWGWEIVRGDGSTQPARVICWDAKGVKPIIALVTYEDHGGYESSWEFDASGSYDGTFALRDAPAPKARGTDWIVRWSERKDVADAFAMAFPSLEQARIHAAHLSWAYRVAIIRVPWTDGMGLEAESSDE